MTNLIAYYRVSTKQQGDSGLGLEAQKDKVARYAKEIGAEIIAEYQDIDSGANDDRVELRRALEHGRKSGAVVTVATLDRLSRKLLCIAMLLESRTPFICADAPNDDPTVTGIKAVLAQDELRKVSRRTKDGLAAKKARGEPVGAQIPACRNLKRADRLKGAKIRGQQIRAAAEERRRVATVLSPSPAPASVSPAAA